MGTGCSRRRGCAQRGQWGPTSRLSTCGLLPHGEEPVEVPNGMSFAKIDVEKGGPVWWALEERLQQSLPKESFTLERVVRVWNAHIWREFQAKKQAKGANFNRRLAFHQAEPAVMEKILGAGLGSGGSACGFDPRLSKEGAYSSAGCATYFAEHAVYPLCIHPRSWQGSVAHLIVAEILCGKAKDFGNGCCGGLRRPPECAPQELYDSVCGTENSIGKRVPGGTDDTGKQHVLFDQHAAYPHFLLTVVRKTCRITNEWGRTLYAKDKHNWGEEVGAGPDSEVDSELTGDSTWWLYHVDHNAVKIINVKSHRAIYAAPDHDHRAAFGAGAPWHRVVEDGIWELLPDGGSSFCIRNRQSKRFLYAHRDQKWTDGVGAVQDVKAVGRAARWELRDVQ